MIYFGIQLYETLINHKIFLFELFVIYVWTIWMVKWHTSRSYIARGESPMEHTTSVVIPVLNEPPEVFRQSLESIVTSNPTEIIVVLDKMENSTELEQIAENYADKVIKCDKAGKRPNLMCGVEHSHGDIIISVDSDTIFEPNTIHNLIKPFKDAEVGGVTTRQHILDPNINIISKFCEWMENVRFNISMPAQSVKGCIGCLPGRAIAFRRKIFLDNKNEFLNQTFMGRECNSGDDRVLTSFALRAGYKTVLQKDAVVYTDCPVTWIKFIKQQLRWSRSSQRETIISLPWLWKRPFTFFCFVTDIITPVFFAVVALSMVWTYITHTGYFDIPLKEAIVMAILGMNMSLGLRQYPHLLECKKDIVYLPLYVLFMTFVMTPIRIYGLLTMYDSGWMTRSQDDD